MVDQLFTPVFKVEVDGGDKTRDIWKYLESLEYTDAEEGESDTVTITVANCPAFVIPARGSALRLWFGWKEIEMKYFGSFIVDESSGNLNPATMSISAKSANVSGSSTAKDRKDVQWENISLAGLAAKIAAKHGCKSKVSVNVYYQYRAQSNESDIAFLRRLAKEAGAALAIKDKTFVIAPSGEAVRAKAAIACTDVQSGGWTLQEREKYNSVKAVWWSKRQSKEKSVTSGSGEPVYVIRKRFSSSAEAKTAASNYRKKLSKSQLEMQLAIKGDPAIVSGAAITCSGFSPDELNGEYLAKSVSHSISKSGGWMTSVTLNKI